MLCKAACTPRLLPPSPAEMIRKPLPNVLELITFNDAPYHPDGDLVRLAVAGAMAIGLIAAADTADPWARTFLLVVFIPECLRRLWLSLPSYEQNPSTS